MDKGESRAWVRSGTIVVIAEFLENNGYDPAEIIGEGPMRMVESANVYRQIDMLHIMSIFQKVADIIGRPEIGLELGHFVNIEQMGPIGFLCLNAPDIRTALSDFVRFGPVLQSQAHFGMTRGKRRVCVEYSSNHPEMPGWEIDSEVSIGYITGIVNSVAGRPVQAEEIHLDHAPICELAAYSRLLGVKPLFNRRVNRVFYPASVVKQEITGANPLLYEVMVRHLSDLADALPDEYSLKDIVRNNIRRGLGTDTVTLEHIASEIGVEPRTLQRRLGKTGTSFHEIFGDVRLERAKFYLERTTLDVTEISFELGYADPSIFSRAFKRWTGRSPRNYRNN